MSPLAVGSAQVINLGQRHTALPTVLVFRDNPMEHEAVD